MEVLCPLSHWAQFHSTPIRCSMVPSPRSSFEQFVCPSGTSSTTTFVLRKSVTWPRELACYEKACCETRDGFHKIEEATRICKLNLEKSRDETADTDQKRFVYCVNTCKVHIVARRGGAAAALRPAALGQQRSTARSRSCQQYNEISRIPHHERGAMPRARAGRRTRAPPLSSCRRRTQCSPRR